MFLCSAADRWETVKRQQEVTCCKSKMHTEGKKQHVIRKVMLNTLYIQLHTVRKQAGFPPYQSKEVPQGLRASGPSGPSGDLEAPGSLSCN